MAKTELIKIASFCAYQERSRPEIEKKLAELEVEEGEWESYFDFLKKEKYFDEKRFAESFVGGKFRVKKWGRRKIAFEIQIHKIPAHLLSAAFDSEIPDEDYTQTIEDLIEKKLQEIKKDSALQKKGKVSRYLLQKGYEWAEFTPILNKKIPQA